MTVSVDDVIGCPGCGGNLLCDDNSYFCALCKAQYRFIAGIPSFMPSGLRSDYALTGEQKDLNERCSQIGWKRAVLEHNQKHNPDPARAEYRNEYMTSEARADFMVLLPLTSNSIVMDLGSGFGNISCAFARRAGKVMSVDTNLENLEFVSTRSQQEGLSNLAFIHADASTLPIRENSLDLVLMIGVLEWVAWGREGKPHQLQKEALQKVFHSLKPGGCLYLALENRYSLKYFIGFKEPHTNIRFISLLPHFLANVYSRIVRKTDFREITYSKIELNNLLKEVGFETTEFYYPVPNYQNFRMIASLNDRASLAQVLRLLRGSPRFSLLLQSLGKVVQHMPLGLLKFFWPSFSVVARK